jgi:hypothetical protein
MRNTSWPIGSLMVIALFLLVAACKQAQALDIQKSPTFSAAALAADGLVIGAVVSSEPARLARESSAEGLASALKERFLEERPTTKILPAGNVELALGPQKYSDFVSFFEKTGDIKVEYVPEILKNLHDPVRYLLVARVDNDEISTSENDDREFKEGKWVTKATNYRTSRETTMLFAIYDLQSSSLEWKGHIKTSNVNTRTIGVSDNGKTITGRNLLDFLAEVLLEHDGKVGPQFPAPVSIQDQTRKIYDEFLDTVFATKK